MSLPPDNKAREQALNLNANVLVAAPAGSGKTGLLVTRALLALAQVDEPEQVVAITFTRKAAAEIRNRLVGALREAASQGTATQSKDAHAVRLLHAARAVLARSRERGWQLSEYPARLRMLTIDSFNSQLANQLPLTSSLGGPTRTSDDAKGLLQQAIERLFALLEDAQLSEPDRAAIHILLRLGDNRIDRLLTPLSELLARRDQWLKPIFNPPDAKRIEVILTELVESQLQQLQSLLTPATVASLVEIVREGAGHSELLAWALALPSTTLTPTTANLPHWQQLVEVLITADSHPKLRSPRGLNKRQGFIAQADYTQRMQTLLGKLAELPQQPQLLECCTSCRLLATPEFPASMQAQGQAIMHCLPLLYAQLRTVFSERGETDFTEIALSAIAALRPEGGYGDALLAADQRIRHLLVDEMQDTSQSQLDLLQQLTSGWSAGDGRSLMLVGDPQQSIYAFRNARVRLFLQLRQTQRLGQLPLQCLQLTANFRSHPTLVDWFNTSFKALFPAQANPQLGAAGFEPCHAMQPATGADERIRCTRINGDGEAAKQAEGEAAALRAMELAQAKAGSIALLAATRTQLAAALAVLRQHGQAFSGQDIDALASVPAVRDYLATARALWHPQDRLHWAILLRAPFIGLSWADLVALSRGRNKLPWPERLALAPSCPGLSDEGRARIARVHSALRAIEALPEVRQRLAERSWLLWELLGGPDCVTHTQRQDVERAHLLLQAHTPDGQLVDLPRFERALEQLFASSKEACIQVLTIHKSKGLEFDHVLLLGCGQGPRASDKPLLHQFSHGQDELFFAKPHDSEADDAPAQRLFNWIHYQHRLAADNERKRLLYVAATRARKSLQIFYSAADNSKGGISLKQGSFAALLDGHLQHANVIDPPAASDNHQSATALASAPLAARLPLDYALPEISSNHYRPQEQRQLRPSAALTAGTQTLDEQADENLYARLVGTLYHEAMQRIARDWANGQQQRWADGGAGRAHSLAAGLRRRGLPQAQVEQAVARILALLQASLNSPHAAWLLKPRAWAHSEYALGGYVDERWVSAVLDRCFEEAGELWVVDYKTCAEPLPAAQQQAYLQQAEQHYRPQLHSYRKLLQTLHPGKRVRAALYFPDLDYLLQLDPA